MRKGPESGVGGSLMTQLTCQRMKRSQDLEERLILGEERTESQDDFSVSSLEDSLKAGTRDTHQEDGET